MKKFLALIVVFFFMVSVVPTAFAQDADISAILKRLDNLEKENQALKTELAMVKASVPKPAPEKCETLSTAPGGVTGVICKKMPLEIYGTVYVDAAWQDSGMAEYPYNAPSEAGDDNGNFFVAARGTRFGINMDGPDVPLGENGKLLGKIEADFLGAGDDVSTSPSVRLRQAYVDLKYPSWDILAGQTWDFFAPLNPPTLNPIIMWRAGNLGIRHAQVRGTKTFSDVAGGKFTVQGGFLEGNDTSLLQVKNEIPVFAGYAYYEATIFDMPIYLGTGGLYGEQDASTNMTKQCDIWGVTFAAKITPHPMLELSAEGYYGEALAPFMSTNNISTITDNVNGKSVRSDGGWFNVCFKPFDKWKINGGAGIDNPFTETGNTAIWDYNYSIYGNVQYSLTSNCILGMEYQNYCTKYWGQNGGEGNRVQASVIYFF